MPDDEKRPSDVFTDVNPSELGRLSPGYTPYNPDLQSWNRGRALGRGGDSYRTQQSSTQPEFTALECEDLSAAARETAVHLQEIKLDSMEQEKFSSRTQEEVSQQDNEIDIKNEIEKSVEIEQEQEEGKDHER
mgnify:CR=1 FL=1